MFYPKGGRSGLMVFTLDWHPGGRGLTFAGSAIFLKNQEWNGMMDSFDGVPTSAFQLAARKMERGRRKMSPVVCVTVYLNLCL